MVVRKNGASGDVFIVDTDNGNIGMGGTPVSLSSNFTNLTLNGTKGGAIIFEDDGTSQHAIHTTDDNSLRFLYGSSLASEAMRIDSSGDATFASDVTISGGDMTLTGATTSIIGEQSAGANRGKIKFVTSSSDGDIVFETTTNGAGAITEAGRFTHDGNLKVINNLIIDSTAGDVTKQKIQFHDDNVGLQRASGSDRTANGNSLYISAFEDIVFTASGAAMGSQTERLRIADDGSATFSGDVNISKAGNATLNIKTLLMVCLMKEKLVQ